MILVLIKMQLSQSPQARYQGVTVGEMKGELARTFYLLCFSWTKSSLIELPFFFFFPQFSFKIKGNWTDWPPSLELIFSPTLGIRCNMHCEQSPFCLEICGEECKEEPNTNEQLWVCKLEMWSHKSQVSWASEDEQKESLQWFHTAFLSNSIGWSMKSCHAPVIKIFK